jgi:hypothetical protein
VALNFSVTPYITAHRMNFKLIHVAYKIFMVLTLFISQHQVLQYPHMLCALPDIELLSVPLMNGVLSHSYSFLAHASLPA